MTKEQISEIYRCIGMLEGFSYSVDDSGVADGILEAAGRIEAVIQEVQNEAD